MTASLFSYPRLHMRHVNGRSLWSANVTKHSNALDLDARQRKVLEQAKQELRKQFGRA